MSGFAKKTATITSISVPTPLKEPSTIYLRPRTSDRIIAGHPWIYKGAIQNITHEPEDGELVQVRDHKRRIIGFGFYNSQSKISVRLLTKRRETIDEAFFVRRFKAAQALRDKLMPGATSYRLINAEGDGLSGLIIDRYESAFSFQISSIGMDQRKSQIQAALTSLYQPETLSERCDLASRKAEGLAIPNPEETATSGGDGDAPLSISLNGLKFAVDLSTGHKTGFYLDQQHNYQAVAELIERWGSRRILDCFTYQGGFALHAARLPDRRVEAIDQSGPAIAQAKRNAAANDLADRCEFHEANVFDWLKQAQNTTRPDSEENKYDAIILDPPSFTRNRNSVNDALRGYKEIHLRALRILKERGLLFSFCCSHHVDEGMFEEVIAQAAFDNRQVLRRIAVYHQSPDHPIIPTIPETHYLKGYAYELLPR